MSVDYDETELSILADEKIKKLKLINRDINKANNLK